MPRVPLSRLVHKMVEKWSTETLQLARRGNTEAMMQLAEMQFAKSGWGVIAHNPVQGRRWVELAASKGDLSAIYTLRTLRLQDELKREKMDQLQRQKINHMRIPAFDPTTFEEQDTRAASQNLSDLLTAAASGAAVSAPAGGVGANPEEAAEEDEDEDGTDEEDLDDEALRYQQDAPDLDAWEGAEPEVPPGLPTVGGRESMHRAIKAALDRKMQHHRLDPIPRPITEYVAVPDDGQLGPTPPVADVARELLGEVLRADPRALGAEAARAKIASLASTMGVRSALAPGLAGPLAVSALGAAASLVGGPTKSVAAQKAAAAAALAAQQAAAAGLASQAPLNKVPTFEPTLGAPVAIRALDRALGTTSSSKVDVQTQLERAEAEEAALSSDERATAQLQQLHRPRYMSEEIPDPIADKEEEDAGDLVGDASSDDVQNDTFRYADDGVDKHMRVWPYLDGERAYNLKLVAEPTQMVDPTLAENVEGEKDDDPSLSDVAWYARERQVELDAEAELRARFDARRAEEDEDEDEGASSHNIPVEEEDDVDDKK